MFEEGERHLSEMPSGLGYVLCCPLPVTVCGQINAEEVVEFFPRGHSYIMNLEEGQIVIPLEQPLALDSLVVIGDSGLAAWIPFGTKVRPLE